MTIVNNETKKGISSSPEIQSALSVKYQLFSFIFPSDIIFLNVYLYLYIFIFSMNNSIYKAKTLIVSQTVSPYILLYDGVGGLSPTERLRMQWCFEDVAV